MNPPVRPLPPLPSALLWTATLVLLTVLPVRPGTLEFNTQRQWLEWEFPAGVLALDPTGTITMKQFRRNINAALDAQQFIYINATGQETPGGIRTVGSNSTQAEHIIDGQLNTWWQPDARAELEDWKLEIDLGRMVQARKIRLIFPDTEGARPFRDFNVFVSEGSRQVIGKDVFQYNRVGGTTLPNRSAVVEYDLRTIENGLAVGEHLQTVLNDTLNYQPVQYIRFIPGEKNADAALAEIEVEALGDNIALDTFTRGGTLRTAHNVQNIASIADGSASKWWSAQALSIDWRESGVWFEWDLGASFWLHQLNMLEPPHSFGTTGFSNSHMIWFEWLTSDGAPVPTPGDDTIQSPFDYQLLAQVDNNQGGGSGRNLHFDFRFPPRKTRYLFWHHESPTFNGRFVFHLFEVFLYAEGFPAEVIMRSPFIDLEGTKSLRTIRWDNILPTGTRIDIRSRTGDTVEEETFYFRITGEEIPEKLWDKLPNSQKLPIVRIPKAGSDWSSWSSVYKRSGEDFLSPSPRNFLQLEVRLINNAPTVAPTLRSIAIDFDDPLVSGGVAAAVQPREAGLDSLTQFRLRIGGEPGNRDQGFDRITIDLPRPLAGNVQVLIGGIPIDPLRVEPTRNQLVIDLPQRVLRDSVEVVLPLRLTSDASLFSAWISTRDAPDILQGIRPAEATALTVFIPEIAGTGNLLRKMVVDRHTLTPNGDGINDRLELELLIVKTTQTPQVRVYDLAGTLVAQLQPSAPNRYQWNGRDQHGALLAPGIYILEAKIAADARTDRRQQLINLVY